MKSIMIIIDALTKGGLQKSGVFLANSFFQDGYKTTICTIKKTKVSWDIPSGIGIISLGHKDKKSKIGKAFECYYSSRKLSKWLKQNKQDAIIVLGDIPLLITYLANTNKAIVVGSERNSPTRYNIVWKKLMQHMFANIDLVVFQTEGARSLYSKCVQNNGVVINNPYFLNDSNNIERKAANYISTAAARFEYKKGIDILISAFSIVHKKYPELKLKIVGDGELKENYITQAKTLGVFNSIIFVGLVDNIVAELINSKVFILPSRIEGIPNTLLEVMGAGIPVVASNCPPGGPKLLTNNGEYGLLYNSNDPKELSEKIIALLENDLKREKMACDAKDYIRTNFNANKIYGEWKRNIEKVLK